jgi:hypothetical protein
MDTESRLAKLEQFTIEARASLTRIETLVGHQADTTGISFATKADVQAVTVTLIRWIVGTAFGMSVAWIAAMTFVLNNATPKAAPPSAPQPIVIQLPSPK